MKVKNLLVWLAGVDPDAEVLLRYEADNGDGGSYTTNYKLQHVVVAFAPGSEIDHQNFDISHHANEVPGARSVVVLSDEATGQFERTSDGMGNLYSPVPREPS